MPTFSVRKALYLSLSLLSLFIAACGARHKKPSPAGFTDETFTGRLQSLLKPIDTASKKNRLRTTAEDVRYTYQYDEYQPIWITQNYTPNEAAVKLIAELEDMHWDGIDTARYNLAAIYRLKQKLDSGKDKNVNDAVAFDTTLTHSYLAAAKDLLIGCIVPKTVDSLWFHANDSSWNAPRLLVDSRDKYPSLDEYRSNVPTYMLLRGEYKKYCVLGADTAFNAALTGMHPAKYIDSAMRDNINTIIKAEVPWVETVPNDTITEEKQLIMAYQSYAGMRPTGKLDSNTIARLATPPDVYARKLKANMERVRWMQREYGNLYLVVDVPLMQLFLRRDGVNLVHMNVVVGKPERQTPSLFATMANIVINPPWGVPPTILKQDVVPGFQKSGKSYLAQKGLKAYDKNGKEVPASRLTEKNLKNYTYKQDPGDDNSLGYVKFNLPNPWDIYLHDTPHRGDFEKTNRALSSGCIRLQHPQEMAIYILSELENKHYTQGRMDTLIETHKTRWELLKTRIPVHIAYLTAFEDTTGKHIQFTRDIYQRDDKLISAMK